MAMEDRKTILGLFAASLLLAPTLALAQAVYEYQIIDYPGAEATQVWGINDHGIAVGNGFDLDVYPFVYDINKGTFTDVANVAGYDATAFIGISDSGRLAGSVYLGDTEFGLIRNVQGTDAVFSHPYAANTEARGVNNQGLVSGIRDSVENPGLPTVGFLYDPKDDSFTDFAESVFTIVHGMNSQGEVVGSSIFFEGDPQDPCPEIFVATSVREYGWLRAADGSLTHFTVNGQRTSARGINDRGQIAGSFLEFSGGTVFEKGFVIDLEGSGCQALTVAAEDLLEFPGYDLTIPEGITNSGDIVGVVIEENVDPPLPPHGFVARPR